VPPEKDRDDVRQGRFAPLGSRPERGAGRQFVWLEVDSVKAALSRPAHQRVPHEEHMGQAAGRWAFKEKT